MLNDPRDPGADRIAIACVGLALVVVLAGVCVISAIGKTVPHELWYVGSAISGILVGTLIPLSPHVTSPCSKTPCDSQLPCGSIVAVMLLLLFCIAAAGVGAAREYLPLQTLGVAVGGVFFGLLIPSPGRRDH
jgi:hypothetical protein